MTRRAVGFVFLWLVLFYSLGTGGHVYNPDGAIMGGVSRSIVEGRGLAIDPDGVPPGYLAEGVDGRHYAKFGVGLSLVALPYAGAGKALAALAPSHAVDLFEGPRFLWYRPHDGGSAWHYFALSLLAAALVAGTCALTLRLATSIGYSPPTALGVTAVLALASPMWPYAKQFFSEPLAALGMVAFGVAAERYAARSGVAVAFVAGCLLGIAPLAKVAHVVLLPGACIVFLVFVLRARRVGDGVSFAAGLALPLGLVGWYNAYRFGTPFVTGYEAAEQVDLWTTPVWTGIRGLLWSPGHGLVTHFPLLLVALVTTRASFRRSPHWTLLAWFNLLALVLLYCRWHGWNGGWCWGPRFLIPAVPWLALLIAPLFENPPRRAALRWIAGLLAALSFWIAFSGTLVPATEFHQQVMTDLPGENYYDAIAWNWKYFTPVAYLAFQPKDFYLITKLLTEPAGWWLAALFGIGVVALVPLGSRTLRAALGRENRHHRAAWAVAALFAGALLAGIAWRSGPHVVRHFDFERPDYPEGWVVEGDAFGSGPVPGPGSGTRLVNTRVPRGDAATGVLRSPQFTLRGSRATFLIGGGRAPERIEARLVVDGNVVARATGSGSSVLKRITWDLAEHRGRRARLELIDVGVVRGAHLTFDDFRLWSDR